MVSSQGSFEDDEMEYDSEPDTLCIEHCSMQCHEELQKGLPQLSPEEKAALYCELTLVELTVAVSQKTIRCFPEPYDRLKNILELIVEADRTYCRTNMDNLRFN
ncbi:hypothetical protein L3Q82_020898 [Scortum barcoo]|uniref:Uncharacterized protein n=1 Tax=Scortum barcoo TaxID=214431 RepID=A0ACB8V8S6_9TELE|nr:hypothetical protein L3Q82_020898 [Scortum barcoo]